MQDGSSQLTYVTPDDQNPTSLTDVTAVTGINALRDTLGGTSGTGASVEQPLTRTPTDVGTYTATTGRELFAADKNAVAFSRTPTQVRHLDIPRTLHSCKSHSDHRAATSCLHFDCFKRVLLTLFAGSEHPLL